MDDEPHSDVSSGEGVPKVSAVQAESKPCGVLAGLSIGIGAIVGGGVFATMGPAVVSSQGGAPLAYALGVVLAVLTAFGYIRMTLLYPMRGGTVGFFTIAFGTGYVSSCLNLLLVVCYACIASLFAAVFGAYLASLLHFRGDELNLATQVFACMGIVAVAYLNLSKASVIPRLSLRLNAIKLTVMGVFMVAAFLAPTWDSHNFAVENWGSPWSVVSGGLMIFISYEGFELIASSKRPFVNPKRTVPIAYMGTLAVAFLFYVLMAVATVGNADLSLAPEQSAYLISAVAERFMGTGGAILLCVGAIVSALSALSTDVFSVSEMPGLMAEQKEMPCRFAPASPRARMWGIVFVCTMLLVFVNVLTVAELTAASSMGFLFVYLIVNLVSLKITPRSKRAWILSGSAAGGCLLAIALLFVHLATSPRAHIVITVALCMLALPFVWQSLYFASRWLRHRGK